MNNHETLLLETALATTGSSMLGNINEVSGINFTSGTSGYIRFTAAGSTLGYIDKGTIQWQWKVNDFGNGEGELNINSSGPHTIYTILSTPVAPQSEPWTETLDISCSVASSESTNDGAMHDIWDDFYNSAGGSYDTIDGSSKYTGATTDSFNLTNFISDYPSIGTVNCYDMGKSVVIFANSLGCGASYTFVYPFGYLNCIKPIGKGWTNNPFYDAGGSINSNPIVDGDWDYSDGRSGFGNHGFSRLGNDIYDASGGQVDVDGDPDGAPHTARDLDGDDTWTSDYDDRVIDDNPASSPGSPTNYSFNVY